MSEQPRAGRCNMRVCAVAAWATIAWALIAPGAEVAAAPRTFSAPLGCVVEPIARAPLVHYPNFACFDDQGRLYVAEGSGKNLPGSELAKLLLGKITRLEDRDRDGQFETATTFADKFIFPAGVLWHDGIVYVASPPGIWKLEDTDDDGQADRRELLVDGFRHDGTGHDVHGPFLGPDGWLYWTDGLRGYKVQTREGKTLEGQASLVWRCRRDGRNIEWIGGGGVDNPVELLFLPDGTLIGTMDQTPGDAILHYVDGGMYPSLHDDRVHEIPRTGPPLPTVFQFSAALPAAICGFCEVRTDYFGPERRGSLMTSQFNVHRLQQHVLEREGSTYKAATSDFAICNDYDLHPTDVLEDADGSLIVVDMGAWYNYECPTAKIAKPDVTGSLYRVHRKEGPRVDDPWGKQVPWASLTPAALVKLLDDARPKVRDRAVQRLADLGEPCVGELTATLRHDGARSSGAARPLEVRRQALWALSRIGGDAPRAAVREALADADETIRLAALHSVSVERDAAADAALRKIAVSGSAPERQRAAEALGRLGRASSIASLQESLRTAGTDRFLEHTLIYALIRLGKREATLTLLQDTSPVVRRAALVALEQMPGALTREQVVPLLDTDDQDLQNAVLDFISRQANWSDEILAVAQQWLKAAERAEAQRQSLTGVLLAFCDNPGVQQLAAAAFDDPHTALDSRILILQVLARCRLEALPSSWNELLSRALQSGQSEVQREALGVIRARTLTTFDSQLAALVKRTDLPAELKVLALACIAPRLSALTKDDFAFLLGQLAPGVDPLQQVAAAGALGAARLNDSQLLKIADRIANQGPLVVPLLAQAFAKSKQLEIGQVLVAALLRSPGAKPMTADDIDNLLRNYPREVHEAAQPLRAERAAAIRQQEQLLADLTSRLMVNPGDAQRGERVFFSKSVGCYTCHAVRGRGGKVGPDLSQVGRFRRTHDLLEAIAVPSSTIVPGFRQFSISTDDGRVLTGQIVRESSDAIFLRTAQLTELRVARAGIEAIAPSAISIMPAGLDKTMSPQAFSDLLEFLYQCR